MTKAVNRKVESRKHAFALIFKLGYHDEVNVQETLDYYLSEYIDEYIAETLSDTYSADAVENDGSGLKSVDEYIEKKINKEYVYSVFSGTKQNLSMIDGYIEKYTKGWKIDRIDKGVLAVLRLAIYEMKFIDDIPMKVSVNEAINLTKEYCGDDSVKFVNGILGNIMKEFNE